MITREEIIDLIECGREIEFYFNKHHYSITYYPDDRKNYISVIEFFKDETLRDVSTAEDALAVEYNGYTVEYMIKHADQEIDIF